MDVKLTISKVYLHNQWDRKGVFESATGGEVMPGRRHYQQWAGDGTKPTNWTEAEFMATLKKTAQERGWNITEIVDTQKQDVKSFQERLVEKAATDTSKNGGFGIN